MFYATLTHWLHVLLPYILHPPPSLLSQNQAQITSLLSSTGDTSCSCKHVCSLFQMLCSCLTYTVHINCTRDLLLFSTLPTRGNWVSVKWLTQDGQESQEVSWLLGLELWTTTAGALQLSSNQPHKHCCLRVLSKLSSGLSVFLHSALPSSIKFRYSKFKQETFTSPLRGSPSSSLLKSLPLGVFCCHTNWGSYPLETVLSVADP